MILAATHRDLRAGSTLAASAPTHYRLAVVRDPSRRRCAAADDLPLLIDGIVADPVAAAGATRHALRAFAAVRE
ncbi:MAG: hypothetical protein IPH44_31435 [Myxococcales bacterium]|nr:hypothetical protein [Myxococcales bacterium]